MPDSRTMALLEYTKNGVTTVTPYHNPEPVFPVYAFYCVASLTSVTICFRNAIRRVQNSAFERCTQLREVRFEGELIAIGTRAFSGCCCLVSINLPDGLQNIGSNAFFNCTSLGFVEIPRSVDFIEHDVFRGCTGLVAAIVPPAVERVGNSFFQDCHWLVSVVLLAKTIGTESFTRCRRLVHAVVPEGAVLGPDVGQGDLLPSELPRIVGPTPAALHRASMLRYWSRKTHGLCSPARRLWVLAVLLMAVRLSHRHNLHLPDEMWIEILSLIPRWKLGPNP